jgi:FtsZ-binding cell division protein ZapB|tara:strand:+ start:465 stop:704 length:240 start_codon:yes stop_codon:yes gene_type:complete
MSENGLALVGNEELAVNFKALVNEIVGLQDQIEELKSENASLWDFNKTAAISIEQLWKIVREDIQGLPVPDGIDLRSMT